jgi:hypothetical protein
MVLCTGIFVSPLKAQEPENLIEYGYAPYGAFPWNFPGNPIFIFKVLQDGTVITRKDPENYYTAQLSPKDLKQLKERLAKERVLQTSHYVDVKKGTPMLLHGGVAFIRYMDEDSAIVLAANILPKSGEMKRIIDIVEKALPKKQSPYHPPDKRDSVLSVGAWVAWKLHEESKETKAGSAERK